MATMDMDLPDECLDMLGVDECWDMLGANFFDEITGTATSMDNVSDNTKQEEETASPAPQEAVYAPKKRGRKRGYPEGMTPSRRRLKKPKVYEMGPLQDEEMEKKRKNAVKAKKHRDQQKQEKQNLSLELAQARAERDRLQQLVNEYELREQQYKLREQQLLQLLSHDT